MNFGILRRAAVGREANFSTSYGFDAIPTHSFDTTPTDVTPDTVSDTVSTNDADISSGDITSSEYARKNRELMQLANDLRAMGAGGLIDLPSIVVIGGQSAGKSSLVEAISGITVPRDSGTCTRCPMECTMSSSANTWACSISLRFEYDGRGLPLSSPRIHAFVPVLTNKNQFEISLRRAQAAILNPDIPHDAFLQKTAQELKDMPQSDSSLKFSKNIVRVEISDSEATDLSFADLPGLIHNETQDKIDLVRSLVEDYIARPNTLILVTIPMSDDIENQQAVRLARDADSDGERTIGVLTKPDTLSTGATSARQRWKQVIEGRLYPLKHGYYCVRLPDDDERSRNVTGASLQRLASEFFASTSPWNEVVDRHRLGIPGFVSDISKLLIRLIEHALPKLKEDVDRLLIECHEGLGNLPAVVTNDPHTEILGRITRFCIALHDAVYGRSQDKSLVHADRNSYDGFKDNIILTYPKFVPSTHLDVKKGEPLDPLMNLHDVRDVIKSKITWELPHNIPFEAKEDLIIGCIDRWRQPARSCFLAVVTTMSDFVDGLLATHFGRFRKLERHMRLVTRAELDKYKDRGSQALENALERENFPVFVGNIEDFDSARKKWLAHYKLECQNYGRRTFPIGRSSNSECSDPGSEDENVVIDDFEDELVVMAEVHAYFEVAHKRISHSVPMTIEHSLNQPLAKNMQESLLKSLFEDPSATESMKELLSEEPSIAITRERLESKKVRLLEIRAKLNDFRV